MRVVLIAGLPGSGKSYLADEYGERGFHVIDDITSIDLLDSRLSLGLDVVVTDPNYCSADTRERVVAWISKNYPAAEVEWVFFENDPAKARANVARRSEAGDDRRVESTICRFEKTYAVPKGHVARPIWQMQS